MKVRSIVKNLIFEIRMNSDRAPQVPNTNVSIVALGYEPQSLVLA